MADKDIKDYCKSCDVEPPAMRFKCPECEHNPDKKQIKDSLKNQDKNFNKNSTHENNQIIINGCNVSGCSYYNPLGNYNCGGTKKCSQWSNCYFKQLARKTQELEQYKKSKQASYETMQREWNKATLENRKLKLEREGLKKQLDLYKTWYRAKHDDIRNLLGSYRKALEGIEGIAKNFGSYAAWQEQQINKILDIINKAKEGEDKQ